MMARMRRHSRRRFERLVSALALCVVVAGLPNGASAAAPARQLVVAGSGSNIAIARVLGRAFERLHPDVKIEVPASIGSTGAIRAVADGAIGVGMIARPLAPKEQQLGLTVVPYARTAVVIGAHPSVPDDDITFDDLVKIYHGTRNRWRDGREIIVLTRQADDAFIVEFSAKVPGFKEAYAESQRAKRWVTLFTDRDANETLVKTPGGIGFSEMGTIALERLAIKALRVNGVAPTVENLAAGRYALSFALRYVLSPVRASADASAFVEFVRSAAGAKIIRASGLAPER